MCSEIPWMHSGRGSRRAMAERLPGWHWWVGLAASMVISPYWLAVLESVIVVILPGFWGRNTCRSVIVWVEVSAHLVRTQMFIHVGRRVGLLGWSESWLHWHWLPWPVLSWLRPLLLAGTRCLDLYLVHQGLFHVKGCIGILYKARDNRRSFLRATAHTSCVLHAAKIFSC